MKAINKELVEKIEAILFNLTAQKGIFSGDTEQQDFDFSYISPCFSQVSFNCDCSSPEKFAESMHAQIWDMNQSDYEDPYGEINIDDDFMDMIHVLESLEEALECDTLGELAETDYTITVTFQLPDTIKATSRHDAVEKALKGILDGTIKLGNGGKELSITAQ